MTRAESADPKTPPPIAAALRSERLRLYQRSVPAAALGQLALGALLAAVMHGHVGAAAMAVWLACLGAVLMLRLWVAGTAAQAAASSPGADETTREQTLLWRFRGVVLATGLVWGLAGWWLFPAQDLQQQTFLAFVLAAVAAGSLTLTAFDLAAALALSLLALAPLVLRLAGSGAPAGMAMAGMVTLFATYLAIVGRRAQNDLRERLDLRLADVARATLLQANQARLQRLSDQLRQQSDALAVTLDNMSQGILSFGADGRTVFYNQRLLSLLDLPEAFMAGRPSMEALADYQLAQGHFGDQLSLVDDAAKSALTGWFGGVREPFPPVYFRRTPSGTTLEVKTRYLPGGSLVRTFSDVSTYVDTLQRLEASEAQSRKLALVAAHTDNAVAITDAQRRVEWVNEGFTRLTGYRLDKLVGRRTAEFLRCADTDATEVERLEHDLLVHRRCAGELLHQAKDGRRYWFAVNTRAIVDDAGQVLHHVGIGRDVSDRRAAEQALRDARDEAQRASQAKSEFLSAMSHELRTPMNAILGFGQLLASDPTFVLPPRQQGQVREILNAGSHLLALINDVLDLARVEAGKQPIVIDPVRVDALLADCLALVRAIAQERAIALSLVVPPGCGCYVAADRTRLKQVLLNLVSNAIKYNHAGGQVSVGCRPSADASQVEIEVSDTGPGLSEDQRNRLFQPFERLGAEQGSIQGAGIGLVLSRRMVELMNGSIGVHSEPGRGSNFWVRLPMAVPGERSAPPAEALPPPDPARPSRSGTVLYIEDNPVNLLLMEALFEHEAGVRLITAHEPALGLDLARSEQPQLILLDIQLPDIDGYEVLRRLRAMPATRSTPVIALSANAMPGDLQKGREAGFDDYLCKPFDMDKLRSTVREILNR